MQAEFKFKHDYGAFLTSKPSPQEVVDFIVYVYALPKVQLQDAESLLAACEQVKAIKCTVNKLGYWYDSRFLIYEAMWYMHLNEVFGKSEESFSKAIEIGLESIAKLNADNAATMGLRTEALLRDPKSHGYGENLKNVERADKILQELLSLEYLDKSHLANHFIDKDLKKALDYAQKGSEEYYYLKLFAQKDKEVLEYYQKLCYENGSPTKNIWAAINYVIALENFDPPAAQTFSEKLEEEIKREGHAECFTHWARKQLRKYSGINGFSVIPYIRAGIDEPSQQNIQSSLRHCDLGLQKISTMLVGPFEYRNKVFLYQTKGWIYCHVMPKTFENYILSLKNYQQALRLYVNVENYHIQLQFVEGRYKQINNEVLLLFTFPEKLSFNGYFKEELQAKEVIKQFASMVAVQNKSFPYVDRLSYEYNKIIGDLETK